MSRSDHYPEGVSGNEFEIAGPDTEQEEQRTCGVAGVTLQTIEPEGVAFLAEFTAVLRELIQYRAPHPEAVDYVMKLATKMGACISPPVEMDCPFDGEVLVTTFGDEQWWVCPLCHARHESGDDR